jgi:hypothetical protein
MVQEAQLGGLPAGGTIRLWRLGDTTPLEQPRLQASIFSATSLTALPATMDVRPQFAASRLVLC